MNVLDENIPIAERELLRRSNIPVRHAGHEIGRKGMKDDEIIPFLLGLRRPTFFTLDAGFFRRDFRHSRYCIVHLAAGQYETARFVHRFLRQRTFRTQAARMGCVIRVSRAGLWVWQIRESGQQRHQWDGE